MTNLICGNGDLREFQELRSRSKTADDFKRLAEWCQQRIELYRSKQTYCESNLRDCYSRMTESATLYPGRDQTLKRQIADYRELSNHWNELMSLYLAQAAELDAASS